MLTRIIHIFLLVLLPELSGSFILLKKSFIHCSGMLSTGEPEVFGQMLGGLTFLKTKDRKSLVDFYISRIGMRVWLEQPDITILSHGNMLLGFHHQSSKPPDTAGMYTFVYPSKEQVDDMYKKLSNIADGPPRVNEKYRIYQFFARDPEDRQLEFQAFLHDLQVVSSNPV